MIIDRMGRIVLSGRSDKFSTKSYNIESLEAGSYILKVIKDRMVETKSFIKL